MKKILLILTIILTLALGIMTYLYINANKNLKDLENDVLDLTNKLIPPKTSYTDSGDNEGGRPTKESGEKRD